MYELARALQDEKRRIASQYRLAYSLPRHHSWSIGRYLFTVARTAER